MGRQIRLADALLAAHGGDEEAAMAAAKAQDEVAIDEGFLDFLGGLARGLRPEAGG